ncbi:hypothetical protein CEE45_09390 [Candidatus Heimdallarchaeota archaeon B3_Heim]|nr:MAG: hypothetical protein CEE45_09390 [Candidatus Heimdallarchaeota archaeon B3_Heim]
MRAITVIRSFCFALENQMKFVTEGLTPEDLRWRLSENSAPAAGWIVGHVLVSHDQFVNQLLLGKSSLLPDDYYTVFGFSSEGEFPSQFSLEDLFTQFKLVTSKVVEELMAKDDTWLEEFPDDSLLPPHWKNRNHMKVLVLHFNHVFTHAGQILEIKRAREKGAWGF